MDNILLATLNSNNSNIFSLLRSKSEDLSPKQKQLCKYLIDNYRQVVFWSVDELSNNSGISPATIVRTVKALGFNSYHGMMEEFQKLVISAQPSLWWEVEKSWEQKPSDGQLMPWIAKDNVDAIQASVTNFLLDSLKKATDTLSQAENIFIVAVRSSRAAGVFLYSMLTQMMNNIHIINYGEEEVYDRLTDLGPKDVLFVVSLGGPHYALTSIKIAEYCANNSIKTILLTNSLSCPAVEYADITLCVEQTKMHYSLVPALTAIEALIIDLGVRSKVNALKKMRKLEKILEEREITS